MENGSDNYRKYLEGDEEAFFRIVKEYKDGLVFYINSIVNNIGVSEELCEDTFVRIGVKKPKNNDKASFKTWLYTIARNLSIDYLRKQKKVVLLSIDSINDVLSEEGPEEVLLKGEKKKVIVSAINKLSPKYKSIIILKYFKGFSNREISIIMKLNKHSVETTIYRAKSALKSELEKEGVTYENV